MILFSFQLILYGGFYLIIGRLLSGPKWKRLILLKLIFASKQILKQEQLSNIFITVEKQIKRLAHHPVIICWFDELECLQDWYRRYYRFTLLENIGTNQTENGIIPLIGYSGEKETYYYIPILHRKKCYGAILVQLNKKKGLPWYQPFLIRYYIYLLVHQYKLVRSKMELSETIEMKLRKMIAQNMHDGLAQKLFFLSAQIYRLKNELLGHLSLEQATFFDHLDEQVRDAHQEVRTYIDYLRSRKREVHIIDTIKSLLEWIEKSSGLMTNFHINGFSIQESPLVEDTIYHFIEEATANVVKHAKAKELHVHIDVTSIQWKIRIVDDGVGLKSNDSNNKGKLGLRGMRERIQRVGGFVSIGSGTGIGTEIIAVIPRERVGMYGTG